MEIQERNIRGIEMQSDERDCTEDRVGKIQWRGKRDSSVQEVGKPGGTVEGGVAQAAQMPAAFELGLENINFPHTYKEIKGACARRYW
jgi:hypothetical protein